MLTPEQLVLGIEKWLRSTARQVGRGSVDERDLYAVGWIEAIRLAASYDPAKGAKFSSYAGRAIRRAMVAAAVRERAPISLPATALEQYSKDRGAHYSGVSLEPATTPRARAIRAWATAERRPSDVEVASPPAADEALGDVELVQQLREAMTALTPRQQRVLRRRFGFDDDVEASLLDLSDELGVCRERVRQIQKEAIAELRRRVAA